MNNTGKAMKLFFLALFLAVAAFSSPVFVNGANAAVDFSASAPDLGVKYPAYSGLSNVDVRITTAVILRAAMGLLGIVFVAIVIYGGYTWMTAGGNDEKIGTARKWIYSGIIGLAIILSSYAITSFVIENLVSSATYVPK